MDETSILRSKLQETLLKQEVQAERVEHLLLLIAQAAADSAWENGDPSTPEGRNQLDAWAELCIFFGGKQALQDRLAGATKT